MAESFSREKLRHAPQKEGEGNLCDPCWYAVHKPDVQNKRDVNTHTHTMQPEKSFYFYQRLTYAAK